MLGYDTAPDPGCTWEKTKELEKKPQIVDFGELIQYVPTLLEFSDGEKVGCITFVGAILGWKHLEGRRIELSIQSFEPYAEAHMTVDAPATREHVINELTQAILAVRNVANKGVSA